MKFRFMATCLAVCAPAVAQTPDTAAPPKAVVVEEPAPVGPPVKIKIVPRPEPKLEPAPAPAEGLPDIDAAIPPAVKALGAPAMLKFPAGIRIAVSTVSEKAQDHVNQGLNHLHGGWEFEASRHFAAALREDPECLLAHWGMVMALLTPSPETGPARNAATDRMLALIDSGNGSELERGYAYGLIKYIQEGPEGASTAFRKVAADFPNDLQAGIFAALFSRGGYDSFGTATPDQEAAEETLLAMIAKHPDSPVPLNALLTIRAEAPDLLPSIELARQLARMAPDYAPYFHLLGHYEWRTGQHGRAASAFGRASSHYESWMKETKATVADCPEWVKAECYRIVSLVSKGDFDNAYAAARRIAATPFPKERAASPGARLLMWDAKTLPARVLLHRGLRGNAHEALISLPKPGDVMDIHEKTLAYWWMDGLRLALEARRMIDVGEIEGAREVAAALTHHGESMSKTQSAAIASGERSAWNRAFRALEILASEIRGRLALVGPADLRGTAYNWFAAATDRQHPAPMMFPPLVLTPMASHLGDFFLTAGKPAEAVESYQRALAAFPNDMNALLGLKNAFEKAGQPDKAATIDAQIESLRAQ